MHDLIASDRNFCVQHRIADLTCIFNRLFTVPEGTVLVSGGEEPIYHPSARPGQLAQVVFARGYFASALHEVAHWCIAGPVRRTQTDYGYWYVPDGRSESEQQAFAQVEIRPQAMEWVFSVAAASQFYFSADNLTSGGSVTDDRWLDFQNKVIEQARFYALTGLPARARRFADALAEFYGTGLSWRESQRYQLNAGIEALASANRSASLHSDMTAAKTA